ncbi:hypothetical protein Q31b_25710 [Novipirellula aureliae]|uniref:Outer membrane efflux protein n=1 Tax=Novipirellula aureliae TaxID=2527966 RepID=A0A5C6E3Y1_9BACT|nr:hypothetical protein [Novipirellula aureliae]TWU43530.1 hypothetical protein Q31b_25710 [Novipirellula aureliae]
MKIKSGLIYLALLMLIVGSISRAEEPENASRSENVTQYEQRMERHLRPVTDPTTGKRIWVSEHRPVGDFRIKQEPSSLERKSIQLAEELRAMSADDENREAKLAELRQLLEKEFDQKHAEHERELAETRQRLSVLLERHQQRSENKNKIVDRRMGDLISGEAVLQWQTVPQPRIPLNYTNPFAPNSPPPALTPSPAANTDEGELTPPPPVFSPQPNAPRFAPGETVPSPISSPKLFEPRSSNDTIFTFARQFAAAKAELGEAETADKQAEELRRKGAIPNYERMKEKNRLERAIQNMELYNMHAKAMRETMERAIEARKEESESKREMWSLVEEKFGLGIMSYMEVVQAKERSAAAKEAFEVAVAELQQFDEAMKAVNRERQPEVPTF